MHNYTGQITPGRPEESNFTTHITGLPQLMQNDIEHRERVPYRENTIHDTHQIRIEKCEEYRITSASVFH